MVLGWDAVLRSMVEPWVVVSGLCCNAWVPGWGSRGAGADVAVRWQRRAKTPQIQQPPKQGAGGGGVEQGTWHLLPCRSQTNAWWLLSALRGD